MNRTAIATLLVTGLMANAEVRADTLLIIGVAVDDAGQRMPGALVRLYATSNTVGEPLAEDRTSERGIFSLYRTNIAGDIGDLFIVYQGESDKVASPLKVALRAERDGLKQSRTSDLVILTIPRNATLTTAEAAERITAITQTEAVLVEAGVSDQAKSTEVVSTRVSELMARVKGAQGSTDARKFTIDKMDWNKTIDPVKGIDVKVLEGLNKAAVAAVVKPGGGT